MFNSKLWTTCDALTGSRVIYWFTAWLPGGAETEGGLARGGVGGGVFFRGVEKGVVVVVVGVGGPSICPALLTACLRSPHHLAACRLPSSCAQRRQNIFLGAQSGWVLVKPGVRGQSAAKALILCVCVCVCVCVRVCVCVCVCVRERERERETGSDMWDRKKKRRRRIWGARLLSVLTSDPSLLSLQHLTDIFVSSNVKLFLDWIHKLSRVWFSLSLSLSLSGGGRRWGDGRIFLFLLSVHRWTADSTRPPSPPAVSLVYLDPPRSGGKTRLHLQMVPLKSAASSLLFVVQVKGRTLHMERSLHRKDIR